MEKPEISKTLRVYKDVGLVEDGVPVYGPCPFVWTADAIEHRSRFARGSSAHILIGWNTSAGRP